MMKGQVILVSLFGSSFSGPEKSGTCRVMFPESEDAFGTNPTIGCRLEVYSVEDGPYATVVSHRWIGCESNVPVSKRTKEVLPCLTIIQFWQRTRV